MSLDTPSQMKVPHVVCMLGLGNLLDISIALIFLQ